MGGLLWRRGTFLPFPFKHAPPIVADVGIDVGMSLHEDQVCPGRCGGQFIGDAGAAVFLLRGGDQEHVALRQDRPQAGEIVAR